MNKKTGMLRPHLGELALVYRLIDASLIASLLLLAASVRGISLTQDYVLAGVVSVLVYFVCAQGNGVYNSWRTASIGSSAKPVLLSWLMTVFVILFVAYATKTTAGFSRIAIGLWLLAVPIVLLSWRAFFWAFIRRMREKGYNTRTVGIAGQTRRGLELAQVILASPDTGLRIIGFFDDNEARGEGANSNEDDVARIGTLDDLASKARSGEIDMIYIALPAQDNDNVHSLLCRLADTTTSVYLVPDIVNIDLLHSRWSSVGSMPVVSVFESPFLGIDGWTKRLEDVVLSVMILLVALLPMLIIAIAIKLTSPGAVIFRQDRYGLAGKRISVLKFRTMNVCENGGRVEQASRNDKRVTTIGHFLRRTSLDELPQFFNVLKGEMSIVGPRPHAVTHNEEYRTLIFGYMLRHKVKPGITGWAQVNNLRGETDTLEKMEKRIEYDLWYIKNWSIMLDLKLIFKTLVVGFSGKCAF